MQTPRQIHISGWDTPVHIIGNEEILTTPLAAYFSSRKYPAKAVLPSLQWAEQTRDSGTTVISGFHSPLEEKVRDILLMGSQPLAWAIARAPYTNIPAWAKQPLQQNRLIIISPTTQPQQSQKTAQTRNHLIITIATTITTAHQNPQSTLQPLLKTTQKPIHHLTTD